MPGDKLRLASQQEFPQAFEHNRVGLPLFRSAENWGSDRVFYYSRIYLKPAFCSTSLACATESLADFSWSWNLAAISGHSRVTFVEE